MSSNQNLQTAICNVCFLRISGTIDNMVYHVWKEHRTMLEGCILSFYYTKITDKQRKIMSIEQLRTMLYSEMEEMDKQESELK